MSTSISNQVHVNYRPEIDGLRALAVIPVILFHAGLSVFNGGFIGVDVFFVISGFLITSIIIKGLKNDTFTFSNFFQRRLRRIAPALLFVVITSIPFAWLLMPSDQFNEFSLAVGSIAIFASNFLFWTQVDYFATTAEINPLLHTWSLAIEEQYYLIFPLILISLYKKGIKFTLMILGIIATISIFYTEVAWRMFPAANFYLFPSRIWELMVGSMAAIVSPYVIYKRFSINNILSLIGFLLLLFSYIWIDEQVPFPSFITVIPVIGTTLILLFTSKKTFVGLLLSMAPFVLIGRISYSLYLWHQPIFVFARLYGLETNESLNLIILFSILFLLSYFSWRFIENPFRNNKVISLRMLLSLVITTSIGFLVFAIYGFLIGYTHPNLTKEGIKFLNSYEGKAIAIPYFREECNFYYHNEISEDCLKPITKDKPITLVWGDSHAQALAVGLREEFGEGHFFAQLATSSCKPKVVNMSSSDIKEYPENNKAQIQACLKANSTAFEYLEQNNIETIIISLKNNYRLVDWKNFVRELEKYRIKKLIIVGAVPQYKPSLPHAYATQVGRGSWVNISKNVNTFLMRNRAISDNTFLENLELESKKIEIIKIHPYDFLCRSENFCNYLVPNAPEKDKLMLFDYGHLSYSGSRYLARELFSNYYAEDI
ncbi:acyltransferase [Methylophilaceae bacterium]|nr:acyltransferase [Methylophilaceae bacterium]